MSELKKMVRELFEQDQLMRSTEKDIKTKRAHYHHLILKNSDKIYSDEEVMTINMVYEELAKLENQKAIFNTRFTEIKNFLKSRLAPLNGGKWIHETEDLLHPKWEFWVEDEELKFARLNGTDY